MGDWRSETGFYTQLYNLGARLLRFEIGFMFLKAFPYVNR
jgi:hypothetical protein